MISSKIIACIAALLFVTWGADQASAQECPRLTANGADTRSQSQTLTGHLIYRDGIRHWFELKLDRPKCGKRSLQLVEPKDSPKLLETLRGCRVESSGTIDNSPTGYYSLDLFQEPTKVRPVGACVKQRPFADYSNLRPDKRVRTYMVDMHVDYRPGDHPIIFHVRSGRTELHPWQAYADYMLTGGFVLYGLCGHDFVVDKVFGTPAARPSHFDDPRDSGDMAMFDPETAAQSGKTDLHLGYTCIRAH